MRNPKWVLFIISTVLCFNSIAQTYVGVSANFGNKLSFDPSSEGMIRAPSISGNLVITKQEVLQKNWVIQYSGALGILGYELKVKSIDTLLTSEESAFFEYSTLYGQFELLFGKMAPIRNKKIIVEIGGGITYYKCLSSVQYGIGVIDNNINTDVFFAEVDCADSNLAGYAKISAQLKLNKMLNVGIEYSHHFSPALSGYYEFYHTTNPSSGSISLYQREISIVFLVNISKKK